MNFAEVLEEFRKKKQLKQKDLAILAGLTPGYVNHLIKGTRKAPSKETIHALARALQLDDEEREKQIVLLLKFLREQRCLLVLDNIESVLQESVYTGKYREGYEGYSRLLLHLGDAKHQSCLLITS